MCVNIREALLEESPAPPYSPGRTRYASGTSVGRTSADTYSRRYNYRSRSDMGRRAGSQTLLEGSRPGPTTPTWRREALETLQRELGSISRTPRTPVGASTARSGTDIARGYSSDTGYLNDTWRSGASGSRGPPPVPARRREQQYYDYGKGLGLDKREYYVTRVACSSSTEGTGGLLSRKMVNLK